MTPTIHPGLASLPATRQAILRHLKKRGEARAETMAATIGITVSGTRQHLTALERDGLIAHRAQRDGPGRPKFLYFLTPMAETLFPRNYVDLTNELLEYVEAEDPDLLARIFDKRARRRLERARQRTAGLSFAEKVRAVTHLLDEDGYLADFEERPDGAFLITEHNCAVMAVARAFPHPCRTEIAFLRAALPEAEITRVSHMIAGGHVCAYEVKPRVSETEGYEGAA